MKPHSSILLTSLLAAALAAGCGSTPAPAPAAQPPAADAKAAAHGPLPESPDEARALRAKGSTWTDVEVREHYLRLVARIKAANDQWVKEGLKAEERARRAYKVRYEARMTSRAMMSNEEDLEALRKRDLRRFGHPDGPTFDELVEQQKKKGLSGDAVYEAIVTSAQRTDPIINELVGASPPP